MSYPVGEDLRLHIRVTVVVTLGLAAGALLEILAITPLHYRWAPLALVYAAGGYPIAKGSWSGLKQRRLSIDFLMGMAALGAAVVGRPMEGAILIFLFSISNLLEHYAIGRTRGAIEGLMRLRPEEATLLDQEGREAGIIPVEQLEPGHFILVRPGQSIAADGQVSAGRGDVDQSAITGESMPVPKDVGDEVFAGTMNQNGSLTVKVTRRAGETMLATIIRLVEEAREQRAPAQHFIDRFAHPYTLGVLAVTVLVAAIPVLAWGVAWDDAFYRAITLLVVASPCALVISTPSAILSGIANGARHGVLFKGGAYLDLAGTVDTIAFDKTGTLTLGKPTLQDMVTQADMVPHRPAPGNQWVSGAELDPENELLRLAAAVEQKSEHHLARAIHEAARARSLDIPTVEDFTSQPGAGVTAVVEGKRLWAGSYAMASTLGVRVSALIQGWTAEQTSLGRSIVYIGNEDSLLGAMSFGDRLKPTASATMRHLKHEGIRWIAVLSGDHPDAVRAAAAELAVDEVRAGLLPDEKVDVVRRMAEDSEGGVAMVGDGVNDSPAMAAATLGIAMGAAGTDVAIETADVVLMSDEIEKVDYIVHLGKRTRRIVRQNVWFSIGWMLALVLVALTVGIPLTLAVVAHEGSTLLVALNGLRLLGGKPHPPVSPRRKPQKQPDIQG